MGQIHSIKRPSAWQNMEQISSRPKRGKNKAKSKTVDEELVPQVDRDMKEKREDGAMRIVLISDTHNKHKMLELPEGDILIHAGDFTNDGTEQEIREFDAWLASLDYQHKIVVPGNHDTGTDEKALLLQDGCQESVKVTELTNGTLLRGEMVEVMGLRVFGLPDTLNFVGCDLWAFGAATDEELREKAGRIPSDGVDILVSHSPPLGIGDISRTGKRCGSRGLQEVVLGATHPPKLWAFGHVHECGGRAYRAKGTVLVNAASFLRSEEGLRPPVLVDICKKTKELLDVRVITKKA